MERFTKSTSRRAVAFAAATLWLAVMVSAGCEKGNGNTFLQKADETGSNFLNPKPEDLVEDPETGLLVIKGVLNIHFSPKLTREEAEKVINAFGGQVVGYDYSVNFYQVKFSVDAAALESKRMELLAAKGIETVVPASVSVHKDPYYAK